jgi:hypothetical protein
LWGARDRIMKVSWSWTGLLLLGWTSNVTAQPASRLALTWNAPPGCPTTENVQARVDALLGFQAASVADVRASGQVERVDSGFRLLLNMGVGSTPSSRVIEARSCDELAGAAAIALALLARSTLASGSEPSSSGESVPTASASAPEHHEDTPEAGPPAKAAAPAAKPDAPDQAASAPLKFVIDVPVGVAGWGLLPSAGLGVGGGLGMHWKALRATVQGELWQPQTHKINEFSTRFTLQSGRAQACLVQVMLGVEMGPCVGAGVQRLTGAGVTSEAFAARSRSTTWVSGVAGYFASLPTPGFAHLRFFGEASVSVSPLRPRFVIDQLGPVHEPSLVAPRLDLGCAWIF